MTQFQFNALQYDPIGPGVELWPEGWHPVIITQTDMKPNQGGQTGRLSLQIKGLDGPVKDKVHYIGLNLFHDNPQTVEIANRTLSAIVHVTLGANQNRFQFDSPNELCNIPFYVLATHKKGDDNVTRVEWRGYKDQRGNEPKGNNQSGGPGPQPGFNNGPANPPQNFQNGPAPQGTGQNGGWNGGGGGQPGGSWNGPNAPSNASPSNPPPQNNGNWQPPQNNNPNPPPPNNGGGWNPPNNGGPPPNNPPQNANWNPPNNGGGGNNDQAPWRRG